MFKKLLKIFTILFLLTGYVKAEIFLEFNITGNDRVSRQTIINFSKLQKNVDLTNENLNDAVKILYDTNFFEDVSASIENEILNINVKEYPIILNIEYNGIKAKKFVKLLKEQSLLKEKNSQPMYFPSINYDNYKKFSENYHSQFNEYPNQLSAFLNHKRR